MRKNRSVKVAVAVTLTAAFVAPVLAAPFDVAYASKKSAKDELVELKTILEQVVASPLYVGIDSSVNRWLWNAKVEADSQLVYGNEASWAKTANNIGMELRRSEVQPILDELNIKLPAYTKNYSWKSYTAELRDLIVLSNSIKLMPGYQSTRTSSRNWLHDADIYARDHTYGTPDEQKEAANRLRLELNRHELRPLVEEYLDKLPSNFTNYREEAYDTELKKLVTIADFVLEDSEFIALESNTREPVRLGFIDGKNAVYGSKNQKLAAIDALKKAFAGSQVRPIYERILASYRDLPNTKDTTKTSNADLVTNLKKAIAANQGQVTSAEFLLNELPKTVRGKEDKLITMMKKAHDLQVESAALVAELTGEQITIAPLRIPAKYK